ncbi:MAG: hypothetical protein ACP5E5_11840 [Acidobacteriaceae bacterium]
MRIGHANEVGKKNRNIDAEIRNQRQSTLMNAQRRDTTFAGWLAVGLFSAMVLIQSAGAQAVAPVSGNPSAAGSHSNGVQISQVMGLNASVDYAAQHNSATGWANIVTPSLSYRFNNHFLVDINVPWYLTVKSFIPKKMKVNGNATTAYPLESGTNLTADMEMAAHYEAKREGFLYLGTAIMGLPTGNAKFSLSANQVTYNLTNHFEDKLGPFIPEVELGEGDSSALADQTVRRTYVAVGPLANFLVGADVELPLGMDFDADAYEELPIGNQNVYGVVTRKGKNGKKRSVQVLDGAGAVEDNGFVTELDVPFGDHFVLVGTYDRSLIQGLDTASAGFTWTFRAPRIQD